MFGFRSPILLIDGTCLNFFVSILWLFMFSVAKIDIISECSKCLKKKLRISFEISD